MGRRMMGLLVLAALVVCSSAWDVMSALRKHKHAKRSHGPAEKAPAPQSVAATTDATTREIKAKWAIETASPGISSAESRVLWGTGPSKEEQEASDALGRTRREEVKAAMQHTWAGYKSRAWGKDDLMPTSGTGKNDLGGIGMTMLDSMDTLWIMGMKTEFDEVSSKSVLAKSARANNVRAAG